MPYLGNEPAVAYTSTTKDSFSGDASTTDFTMSKSANVNAVRVVVENVVQNPTVAYTCSGTTLSFTSAPPTGTNNIYVVHLGPPAATVAPPTTINNSTTFGDGADIITASKGTDNVRIGEDAGASIASGGNYNVAIGKNTLTANTTGDNNTAVGYESLKANTTASNNVGIGYQAGYSTTTGTQNTFIAGFAGYNNTTGNYNTAVGYDSFLANTTGVDNTALGTNALQANTTGNYNTAVGRQSLTSNTTASYGTGLGWQALQNNTTGAANTAVGYECFEAVTTATRNTGVGMQAGHDQTTGGYNTYVGTFAGEYSTTGNYNTAIGDAAGSTMTTGDSNTFVGQQAGNAVTTGAKNTILGRYTGNQGGLDIRTSSNNIVLADGDGNPRIICNSAGEIGMNALPSGTVSLNVVADANNHAVRMAGPTAGYHPLLIDNTGSSGTRQFVSFRISNSTKGSISSDGSTTSYNTSSDYRLKENVTYDWDATSRLKQLKPARFNFIIDPDTTVDGFLAHEAQSVIPESVTGTKDEVDDDGNAVMQGIDQSKLVPLLVKTIQELEARITALEAG